MNEELKIIISAEISKLKQNVEKAKQSVKGFQEQVQKASKDVDKNFKAMGTAIASGIKYAATGFVAMGTALLALGASTAEYRNQQAQLVTAFETAGSTAEQAKDTYNDLYRVLGDGGQATEAAQHLAALTTNQNHLVEWTSICTGVYATFGNSLPIEGLTEAVNHTANLGEVQGVLADALEWSGISVDDFNAQLAECTTKEEREALIRSTLNGLYNEAAHNYEKNNAAVLAQNEANAKLQETTAALGEAIAPVVTAFTNFANEALAIVTPYIEDLAATYLPQLKTVLSEVAEGLGVAMGYVKNNLSSLAVIGSIIMGIVAAIGLYNAVQAIKQALNITEALTLGTLTSALLANAAAMLVAIAPYIAAVAIIAAVIAIIVVCIKEWETIKEVVVEAFQQMVAKTKAGVKEIVDAFKLLGSQAIAKVKELATKAVEKFNELKTKCSNAIQNTKEAVVTGFQNMVSNAEEKVNSIVSAVSTKFTEIKTKIKEAITGAKDAVKSGLDSIKNFFSSAKWSLPKIKLPKISISGNFSLNPPSVPSFSISWNKLGGIFDKPTLFNYGGSLQGIGENGAEAVVPLENNLGWLDKLAGMLSSRMGGNTPIVLNVDGKIFAQTAINTINQQTRQTGKLALNLM